MTCLTKHLEGEPCIKCERTDQVYLGHGEVRFCAHCTLSWDPYELLNGKTLFVHKSVVLSDETVDGELPEDIIERMGLLAGNLYNVFAFDRRLEAMMAIPEELFTAEHIEAEQIKHSPGDYDQAMHNPYGRRGGCVAKATLWQDMVTGFSRVMVLVHLSMRMLPVDTDQLYDELLKARELEFNDAVSDYMAQMECGGQALLQPGPELDKFKAESRRDAGKITETYNRDLARSIANIRETMPRANRHTYAKRLREWERSRAPWKVTQISLHTVMTARDYALKSFSKHNGLSPDVRLQPLLAKEPICQGWVNRGKVSFEVARRNPSPYHVGCVHYWQPLFVKGNCVDLWQG